MGAVRRSAARTLTLAVTVLLLPLPWRAAPPTAGPGTAWRVDGRLEVAGVVLDPPGEMLWLASGRPQLLVERLVERSGRGPRSVALVGTGPTVTPGVAVPAAVAAALSAAGREVADADTSRLSVRLGPLDIARAVRGVGLGDSNGLAIAAAVLRAEGLLELGDATVAATGRIAPDGTVHPVGGLGPKTRAAVRAGATLLLVPAAQVAEVTAVAGPDGPRVVGVVDLATLLGQDIRQQ